MAGVVLAAVLAAEVVAARRSARPADLPRVSPAALIASSARAIASGRPVSGSISATLDLGLPDVGDIGSLGVGGGLLPLLTGTHVLKVWRSAAGLRVSDIEPQGERALFVSRTRAWAWDFDTLSAVDLGRAPALVLPIGGAASEAAARTVLARIADTTRVSLNGTTTVAGRPAYRLVISPRQRGSLVGEVELDIDGKTRFPLAVSAFAGRATQPAISIQFTSVSFGPIDPSVFRFSPPPGASVRGGLTAGASALGGLAGVQGVRTFGRAWTTVFALRIRHLGIGGLAGAFLPFSGSLVSADVADRGNHSWVVVGAVPATRLAAVERDLT